MGFGIIWTVITSRFGGWIVGGVVALVLTFFWQCNKNDYLVQKAAKETAQQGLQIGYEGYVKLYQEREKLKAQADQQRRKLNELRQTNDLDGLADTFNNPGGVRRPLQPNPQGGVKAPARRYRAAGTGEEYQEAP